MSRPLTPCGVGTGGYQRHLKAGEEPCDACRRSQREYQVKRRGGYKSLPLKPCGTTAAYTRHLDRGEDVCPECREAWRVYQVEWRRKHKQARIEQARGETIAKQAA